MIMLAFEVVGSAVFYALIVIALLLLDVHANFDNSWAVAARLEAVAFPNIEFLF